MPEGKQELVAVRAGQSNPTGVELQQKQRRQMLIALAILLLALVLLLLKDWHYWFAQAPASPATTEQLERSIVPLAASANSSSSPAKVNQPAVPKSKVPVVSAATAPAIVTTDRAVLPPLEVEVVA